MDKENVMNELFDKYHEAMENHKAKTLMETKDLADSLFFAFRYALTRKTYVTITVQNTIKRQADIFDKADFALMKKEIEEADKVGTDDWFRFHEWLKQKSQ